MKTSPALRWACYAIAAAATAAAMWHVDQREPAGDTIQPVRPAQRGMAVPASLSRPAAPADALAILKQRLDAAMSGSADPFSDGRAAAAAPAPAAQPEAAAMPAAVAAPVQPFTYLGRWQEQGGTVVFLQAGDRVLSVRGPGPLEGGWSVESVGADSVVLKGSGQRQTISFASAAHMDAPAGAPQPVATTTASTPSGAQEEN
jgi:hypothetical protein